MQMKGKILVRRMLRSPQFMIGFFIVFGIVIVSVFARQLAPMDENMNHIVARFTPPQGIEAYKTGGYVLGSDELGRDILSRVLIGSQISLRIAFIGTVCVTVVGTLLGVFAGYFGGVVDDIVMRATEVTMAIPSMTLGIVIMAIFGPSISNLILVMIITIINICFIKLPKLWASADQTGPDLYSRIISSEDGAVMLDNGSMGSFQPDRIPLLLCDLVPSLLFIWVLIASFRLCRSLKDNHFTDQTIQDAGALSHLCVRVLCITAVLEVVRNILQLLMLPSLSDTTFTVLVMINLHLSPLKDSPQP